MDPVTLENRPILKKRTFLIISVVLLAPPVLYSDLKITHVTDQDTGMLHYMGLTLREIFLILKNVRVTYHDNEGLQIRVRHWGRCIGLNKSRVSLIKDGASSRVHSGTLSLIYLSSTGCRSLRCCGVGTHSVYSSSCPSFTLACMEPSSCSFFCMSSSSLRIPLE